MGKAYRKGEKDAERQQEEASYPIDAPCNSAPSKRIAMGIAESISEECGPNRSNRQVDEENPT